MMIRLSGLVNNSNAFFFFQAKQELLKTGYFTEGIPLHFTASMLSGLITTLASMPIDMAKTRIQNQKKSADGTLQYKGSIDVMAKVARQEGILSLWKGFTPYYCRLGPHTVITFIVLEQFNNAYTNYMKK